MNDGMPDNNRDDSNQQREPHLVPSWNLSVRKQELWKHHRQEKKCGRYKKRKTTQPRTRFVSARMMARTDSDHEDYVDEEQKSDDRNDDVTAAPEVWEDDWM